MANIIIACVGGFLGAGKTTALAAGARELVSRGLRVGIITNDQGSRLVDTEFLRDAGLATEEVTGGCFCCRFDDLLANADRIADRGRPDVIFAEAVGSCTDLTATVLQPLQRFYADRFDVSPLTVFVEPSRLRAELLGLSDFPGSVSYLFEKQLAEADLIVLNKLDLIREAEQRELVGLLERRFAGVTVLTMSALSGANVSDWIDRLLDAGRAGSRAQEVDYATYAEAEALLGWLNATIEIAAETEIDPRVVCESLLATIQRQIADERAAIAHLKILVATEEGSDRLAVTNNTSAPQWSGTGDLKPVRALSVILNARVRTSPEALERMVRASIDRAAERARARAVVQHLESFSPAPPVPVHRFANDSPDTESQP